MAFGYIETRLTAAKELGSFITTPDGTKVPLGIPQAQKDSRGGGAHKDIPLGRPGTASEAASAILAVASPLFSYITGQVIMVSSLVCYLPAPLANYLFPGHWWSEYVKARLEERLTDCYIRAYHKFIFSWKFGSNDWHAFEACRREHGLHRPAHHFCASS